MIVAKKMTDDDYYSLGTSDDIVISSTSLKYIDPESGGSPRKFMKFFEEPIEERKESKFVEMGVQIHKFIESPEEFVISDIEKPTEMMCTWVNSVKKLIDEEPNILDLLPSLKKEDAVISELELTTIGDVAIQAKEDTGVYSSLKDLAKIRKKFYDEGIAYLLSLYKTDGRIVLTKEVGARVIGAKESLYNNANTRALLFNNEEEDVEEFNEFIHVWVRLIQGLPIRFKMKVDRLIVNHKLQKITIIDLKTTSVALSLYKWTFKSSKTYRQLSMYGLGVRDLLSEYIDKGYTVNYVICAVETMDLYECEAFLIEEGDTWIQQGNNEIEQLLGRVIYHMNTGNWVNPMEVQVEGCMRLPRREEMIKD